MGASCSRKTRDTPTGTKNAARTRNRDLIGNSRELPREYVRLKQSQIPGRNDFVTSVRPPQKAALSGIDGASHIAPKRFSSAKLSIPAEKHQVANERRPRQTAATARAALNVAATKANAECVFTIRCGVK